MAHSNAAALTQAGLELPEVSVVNDELIDPLTAIGNRRALYAAVEVALRSSQPVSVLLLDLDEFRVVNDAKGHAFGDRMLAEAAKRLATVFSERLFRPGGDQFAIVLPSENVQQLTEVAETVLAKWSKPLRLDGIELYSGVSIGIVTKQPDHRSAVDMLRDAESAVYLAKDRGRSQWAIFNRQLRVDAEQELSLQMLTRRAVAEREFRLFWQPIIDRKSDTVYGCEALLRWRPAGGERTMPAAEFIPFLERSGLIIPVGELVLEQAFQQWTQWAQSPSVPGTVPIHINVSGRQLLSGSLARSVITGLTKHGVPAEQLTIDVPAAVASDLSQAIVDELTVLQRAGVRIALDEFGGKASSLTSLTAFPFDLVKIDRSAIARIQPDTKDPVVPALHGVLVAANRRAVACGVETAHQVAWLDDLGCEFMLGYHFAAPTHPDESGAFFNR